MTRTVGLRKLDDDKPGDENVEATSANAAENVVGPLCDADATQNP